MYWNIIIYLHNLYLIATPMHRKQKIDNGIEIYKTTWLFSSFNDVVVVGFWSEFEWIVEVWLKNGWHVNVPSKLSTASILG